jgi:hypothetical protein
MIMKAGLVFTALALAAFAGCYDSSTDSHDTISESETSPDPGQDPPVDMPLDWDCDEAPVAVVFVVYSRVVFPMTPIGLVVLHESAVAARLVVGPVTSENVIEIDVVGYPLIGTCLCNDGMWCGPTGVFQDVSSHTLDGLPEGEYILRINGTEDYPLLVAGPECLTYATSIGNVDHDEIITRGYGPAQFHIESFGHSCDCGGDTSVEQRISEETAEIWIDVTEVVCRPEQCCDTCECIDAFQNTVFLWDEDLRNYSYTVHINGNDYTLNIAQPLE